MTGGNTASLRDGLDYYPTPRWATEALLSQLGDVSDMSCLEPAAGGGHMADVLAEHFAAVDAFDIADPEGRGWGGHDFLTDPVGNMYDWAITNPPYRWANEFVLRMLDVASNVAVLCRLQWLESKTRYDLLWSQQPPSEVIVFTRRMKIVKGRLCNSEDRGNPFAYAWYLWLDGHDGDTRLRWFPHSETERMF